MWKISLIRVQKLIIVEACDSVGVKSAFELCEKAGVPVLSVNQILDDDLIEMIAGTVTADNYQAGMKLAKLWQKR